jgi:hypothetical protein
MEKKDQSFSAKDKATSFDKSKLQALIKRILVEIQQPELSRIAFSVQYWDDESCSDEELFIPGPPSGLNSKSLLFIEGGKDDERKRIWRNKIRIKLAKTSREDLISLILKETERMSHPTLQHLSQSLMALQRRK